MKKTALSLLVCLAACSARLSAQTVRSWTGSSTGAWLTTTNWTGGFFAGKTGLATPPAGEGAVDDIMAPAAANAAANIGINMNTITAGAGGFGLQFGGIDWNKTSTAACTIGNSSTTVGGILRLNGATLNSIANTFVRVSGSANLTLASANSGTATAAQTLQLQLGSASGVFQVDPARILTVALNNITGLSAGTGWTLSGGGQLIINSPSSIDGPIAVSSGRAQAGNATAFGSGPVTVTSGAQAYILSSLANSFTIAGDGWTETAGQLGALRFQGGSIAGAVNLSDAARIGAFNGSSGALNGPLSGTAALQINGADTNLNGTISLNGNASAFSGPITVTQGRLNVNAAAGPAGPVTVEDGAALGGEGSIGGALTLGAASGALLYVDPGTPAVLTASGDLTVNGVATVNLTSPGSTPVRVLKTMGTLNATSASFTLPGGLTGYRPGAGFDTTTVPGEVLLNLPSEDLIWSGASTADWNAMDTNWTGGGGVFFKADRVTFDDSGTPATNIPAGVQPGRVTVDITTTDRTFTGPATAGSAGISGTTSLLKKGSGKLTISNLNTYTGGTRIENGILEVGAVDAIPGAGGVRVAGGILRVNPVVGLTASTTTITLGDASSTSSAAVEIPSAATADQVVLSTPVILDPAAPSGTKAILRYAGTTPSGGSPQFNGPVTLNGRDLWLENTSDSNGNTVRLWNMYGKISGTGNVHVDVDGPSDRVRIGFNGNDFNGNVVIDRGMLQNGTGSGSAQNAIPDASLLVFAPGTRLGLGAADTIGGLSGGAADPGAGLAAALVSPNVSSGSPTLTVGGGNRSAAYDGTMANSGANNLLLSKTGTGTQTLNGDCSFTGATALSAGRLNVNAAYASAITVSGGATLGGTGTSSAAITATATTNGGANVAPGFPTGTLSAASANLSGGGNLLITLDGAAGSKLSVTGVLNLTNTDLIVSGTGSATTYMIASYGTLTGTFASVPAGYTVDYAYNDGVSSNNVAITLPSDPYITWAATKGLTAANNTKTADPDGDGVASGLEFYLDGNPLSGDSPSMTASTAGGNLRLTFKRRDDAESLNVIVETSTTMAAGSWAAQANGVNGVVINVTENGAAPDDVEVLIPASGSRLFARLFVLLP